MNELFNFIFYDQDLKWDDKLYLSVIGFIFLCVIIYSCLYPTEDRRLPGKAARILRRSKIRQRPLLYVIAAVTEDPDPRERTFHPPQFTDPEIIDTRVLVSSTHTTTNPDHELRSILVASK
jgi:hypothetical protein